MTEKTQLIHDVSDTALWVAYYRAKESLRSDALFKDPFADLLVGERGKKIAEDMNRSSRFSEWTVIMRTVIIDAYIQEMVKEGVDTVLNLGAGMDTRPYRMQLPENLKWIEVDYPHVIAHKAKLLNAEHPNCQLSRVELDLGDVQKRKNFFQEVAGQSKNILVLTEGVILYLSEEQTAELGADLNSFPSFKYWIVEYIDPMVYPHLKNRFRSEKLKNAPFRFFPENWLLFFEELNWIPKDIRYFGVEGAKLGRRTPMPRFSFLFRWFASKAQLEHMKRMSGFILLKRKDKTGSAA